MGWYVAHMTLQNRRAEMDSSQATATTSGGRFSCASSQRVREDAPHWPHPVKMLIIKDPP